MSQMSIDLTNGQEETLADVKKRIKDIQDIKPAKPKLSPFYETLAKNIAAARRMSGLDQSTIGSAIYGREAKNRICEYETGSQRPSVETLFKLAKALGCSADYLLGLSSELEVSLDSSRYGAMYATLQETSKEINRHISKMMVTQLRTVPTSLSCTLMSQAEEVAHYLDNIKQFTAFEKKINGAANLIKAVEAMTETAEKMRRQVEAQMRSLERAVQDAQIHDDAEQGHLMAWETVEPLKPLKVRRA